MGTNYYITFDATGKYKHLGKSAAGWCFALHIYPEEGIDSFGDWVSLLQDKPGVIRNEYGDILSIYDLIKLVCERSWPTSVEESPNTLFNRDEEFYEHNEAEPGPNNLVRCKIGHNHCVGHSEGTWDYFAAKEGLLG